MTWFAYAVKEDLYRFFCFRN